MPNYADSVVKIVKSFVDSYPYVLSDSFCGDETYIRIGGKWHNLFFCFDAVKKMILPYYVSPKLDTHAAIKPHGPGAAKTPRDPKDLRFIVDGNPFYILAQHFFAQYGIHFDIHQVIGLTNDDPVSTSTFR